MKYKTIANLIVDDIENGTFSDKLPGEYQLMDRYNVSRNTVRKALNVLVEHGFLTRIHGSGYFINKEYKNKKTYLVIFSARKGISYSLFPYRVISESIKKKKILSDKELSTIFKCSLGAELLHVIRKRTVNGELFSVESTYYLAEIVPDLPESAITHSVFAYLQDELHMNFKRGLDILSLGEMPDYIRLLMEIEEHQKIINIETRNSLTDGRMFSISRDYYHPDRVRFVI